MESVEKSPTKSVDGESSTCVSEQEQDEILKVETIPRTDLILIEGWLKFRDSKRWKQRWGVVTKLSPAADCLHLQLYRDSKDHYRQGQTKASLSLQHFLALETGFTLDKESNTLGIICQDITVVLAFDSRELLIQWQVKVASNLGDDQQVLVQVASAPARSKISPGPAHLHIREYKFCLTSGVPPRLLGFWEISQLRKYGVVNGRFCFEGGSQCGKSEGLYVLITNQGNDITQALQLAAEGKPICQKRTVSRNVSVSESPRRLSHWRNESHLGGIESNLHQSCAELTTQPGLHSSHHILYGSDNFPWLSSETNLESSEFGDSMSFGDQSQCSYQEWQERNQDYCSNCMTESCSSWNTPHRTGTCESCNQTFKNTHQAQAIPIQLDLQDQLEWKNVPGTDISECSLHNHNPHLQQTSSSSPSFSKKCYNSMHATKLETISVGCSYSKLSSSGFNNYDTPKAVVQTEKRGYKKCSKHSQNISTVSAEENYDTPRNIREKSVTALQHQYSNYDTPPSAHQIQLPLPANTHCTRIVMEHENCRLLLCPCQRIFGWIPFPYCYRGYGIEHTGSQFCKVQLTDEKLKINSNHSSVQLKPEPSKSGKGVTVHQMSITPRICSTITHDTAEKKSTKLKSHNTVADSMNIKETESPENVCGSVHLNYENMEFADSLKFYENSRDLIKRTGVKKEYLNDISASSTNLDEQMKIKENTTDTMKSLYCSKCGHECNEKTQDNTRLLKNGSENIRQDDYTLMRPDEFKSRRMSKSGESLNQMEQETNGHNEYLHMSPLANSVSVSKIQTASESNSKSINNIPYFFDSRPEELNSVMRVPGKAVLCVEESPKSMSNCYPKRNFKYFKEEQSQSHPLTRQRSNSIDCSRYSEEKLSQYFNVRREKDDIRLLINSLQGKNYDNMSNGAHSLLSMISQQKTVLNKQEIDNRISIDEKQQKCKKEKKIQFCDNVTDCLSFSSPVQVRRSSSVPCKSGNRDSSSSNDSGVSTGSPKFQRELEQVPTKDINIQQITNQGNCLHSSLPRRSKNIDPLQELSFQFQTIKPYPDLEISAPGDIKDTFKGYICSNTTVLAQDSRSTSSATSDMSDYIETLSLSSYSSSDTPESLRLSRSAMITLKPRSGKEYHKVDRCILDMDSKKPNDIVNSTTAKKAESPSPEYSSSSPLN
ncbi:uncharacterized protein LOC142317791 [Lycorma delicatula]|uniref:uncharacterized protein LOC142317791 n=1 Tax=Lycorma delicatula TaxID=130591 RepID=UPI003F5124D8